MSSGASGGPRGLILGIDPGLASTGYGLIAAGGALVTCGSIRTLPGPAGRRLYDIVRQVEGIVRAHEVAEAALEELFMGRNRTSVIGVAQARGAILALLEREGVPSTEYKPSQVKSVLTGYGSAGKAQMSRMLALQVGLGDRRLDDHAVDAVAIAVCHARSRRLRALA